MQVVTPMNQMIKADYDHKANNKKADPGVTEMTLHSWRSLCKSLWDILNIFWSSLVVQITSSAEHQSHFDGRFWKYSFSSACLPTKHLELLLFHKLLTSASGRDHTDYITFKILLLYISKLQRCSSVPKTKNMFIYFVFVQWRKTVMSLDLFAVWSRIYQILRLGKNKVISF